VTWLRASYPQSSARLVVGVEMHAQNLYEHQLREVGRRKSVRWQIRRLSSHQLVKKPLQQRRLRRVSSDVYQRWQDVGQSRTVSREPDMSANLHAVVAVAEFGGLDDDAGKKAYCVDRRRVQIARQLERTLSGLTTAG
jgi:hypothetical protein